MGWDRMPSHLIVSHLAHSPKLSPRGAIAPTPSTIPTPPLPPQSHPFAAHLPPAHPSRYPPPQLSPLPYYFCRCPAFGSIIAGCRPGVSCHPTAVCCSSALSSSADRCGPAIGGVAGQPAIVGLHMWGGVGREWSSGEGCLISVTWGELPNMGQAWRAAFELAAIGSHRIHQIPPDPTRSHQIPSDPIRSHGIASPPRQDVIGTGGSSRVYRGMYAGKLVAVKEIAATAMMPHGRAEAALLSRLRHPYVLHFYGNGYYTVEHTPHAAHDTSHTTRHTPRATRRTPHTRTHTRTHTHMHTNSTIPHALRIPHA